MPVLCFAVFSLFTTFVTLGGAISIGLFFWLLFLSIYGMFNSFLFDFLFQYLVQFLFNLKFLFIVFFLLISLVCVFFITCTVFFWIALAALIGRIIFKYLDEYGINNQTNENFDNHETTTAIKP